MEHLASKKNVMSGTAHDAVQTIKDIADFMYGDEKRTKMTFAFAYGLIVGGAALHMIISEIAPACSGSM